MTIVTASVHGLYIWWAWDLWTVQNNTFTPWRLHELLMASWILHKAVTKMSSLTYLIQIKVGPLSQLIHNLNSIRFHVCNRILCVMLSLCLSDRIVSITHTKLIHYNWLKGCSLSHDQAELDIRQRCWPRVLAVDVSTFGEHRSRISSVAWSWWDGITLFSHFLS